MWSATCLKLCAARWAGREMIKQKADTGSLSYEHTSTPASTLARMDVRTYHFI